MNHLQETKKSFNGNWIYDEYPQQTREKETSLMYSKDSFTGDLTGGPVVKTSPSNAGGAGSIPGWETKIPHMFCKQPKKYCNKFSNFFLKRSTSKKKKKL